MLVQINQKQSSSTYNRKSARRTVANTDSKLSNLKLYLAFSRESVFQLGDHSMI